MDQMVEEVRAELISAIENDKLVLPTLPEIALRVREVAEDPNASIDQMVTVIGHDAALTIRIIKVANSPLLRAAHKIEDLKMALMRLGIEYTCNLATGLAMEQMYQATSDMVDRRLREVWSHSSEIAGLCYILCKHRSNLKVDKAALAGLVHKIGVLPILTFAEENSRLLKDSFSLDLVIEQLHPEIGELILRNWNFPEELIGVPKNYMDFNRDIAEADYTDLVTVATLQSYIGSDHPLASIDYSTVGAFARLGIDTDFDENDENLADEMEAAMSLLTG
ncbi:HDOD domain-containing protein [Aurantivibrio infirmus]